MLQWCDDFNSYGSNVAYMVQGLYAQAGHTTGGTGSDVALVTDPDPLYSNKVFRFDANPYGGGGAYSLIRKNLDNPHLTVGVAIRVYLPTLPSSNGYGPYPIVWCDSSNNILAALRINTDGSVSVNSGSFYGTTLGTSDPNKIVAGSWIHIEAKLHMDAAAGTLEVRIEGIPVINLTGLALSATNIGIIQVALDPTSTSAAETYYVKDFVTWNGAGTENNDFLGSVSVTALTPDSDVATAGWTLSTGTDGYALIDETPPNDDTDYIEAPDPPPAQSEFGLSNLPANVSSVKGLMTLLRASKTDGGDGQMQVGMKSAGTENNGTDRAIASSYTYYYDFFETDPDTGVAWLPGAVDAATITLDRTL